MSESSASESPGTQLSDDEVYPLLYGLADEVSWQERALCAQTDPESFFPEKGGSTREAKRVCLSCEVRSECLDYALNNDERFGIWGGLSERERRRLKKRAVSRLHPLAGGPTPPPRVSPTPHRRTVGGSSAPLVSVGRPAERFASIRL